jgi:glycosyltransferase involved in cell wall biosynthesis
MGMERRFRILIVSLDYPPPVQGGYGVWCHQICSWLKQRGHDILVLTVAPQRTEHLTEEDIPVQRLLQCYWNGSECVYPPLLDALAIEQANQAQFRTILDTYRPDVISFWHMGTMSLGLISTAAERRLPIVFVIGDDWLCYGWWADAWIRRFTHHPKHAAVIERHTGIPTRLPDLGATGTFCFVSDFTRQRAERIGGWRFRQFDITHPGISRTEFPPSMQLPKPSWGWRLLWVGRLIEGKGIVTAINALSSLPLQAVLEVVGPFEEPAYRQYLEQLAAAKGLASRITFSVATHQELRERYQRADVTLFTSMIEHEAFGLVPLEAMASGCPVISTCIGGSGEYCSDGVNCLCVPPGDADALAQAIRQLAASYELRRRLVEGGLRTASELTLEGQAERIERWLLSAAARSDSSPNDLT